MKALEFSKKNMKENPEMFPILVYGTLLTGEPNWDWSLAPIEGVKDEVRGFSLYSLGGYPGMIPNTEQDSVVQGELFLVDKETRERLDRLEGHPGFYTRTPVVLASGIEAETYVYQGDTEGRILIESGNWLKYLEERNGN